MLCMGGRERRQPAVLCRKRALLLLACCAGLGALRLARPRHAHPCHMHPCHTHPCHTHPCHTHLCHTCQPPHSGPAALAPARPTTATPDATEKRLRLEVERQLPSLPLRYFHAHYDDRNKFYKTVNCSIFPFLFDLDFHNKYWQTMRSSRGVFHLYGAYLDLRKGSRIGPAVRLLAVHDRIDPSLPTHCQMWFEERPGPVIVRVIQYNYLWSRKWGNSREGVLQPYLLTCVLPNDVRALRPAAVSLVEKPCDRATNCLRVHFDQPPDRVQKEFAVCVKGLDFLHEDISARLVEWIELLRLLGADKILFYEFQVHPNISKILTYYHSRGIVDIQPITLPGGQPNLPGLQHLYLKEKTTHKRQMELVPYNDCLYRYMYRYRWLALLDVDEVIVPLHNPDWSSLLKSVAPLPGSASWKSPQSSYHVSNVYYPVQPQHAQSWEPGAPRYMHMLQHVYRMRNFSAPGHYVKAFHETGRVLALHNHFPIACIGGECSSYPLGGAQARLQHYRARVGEPRAGLVRDAALWRWADRLVPRVTRVLGELALIPAEPSQGDTSPSQKRQVRHRL